MKVTVDGSTYDYDANRLMVSEAMEIQEKTGLNLRRWNEGLQEMDARAVKGLIYLLKRRAGETVDWASLDFDIGTLDMSDDEPAAASPKEDTTAA
jgi:hypothetical protein